MVNPKNTLTIGQVARRAGVNLQTIRFYEREGLVLAPARTPAGYRQFPIEVVGRIRFIKRAQELGFTLEEIRELLSLRNDETSSCNDVKQLATNRLQIVQGKIKDLRRMEKVLKQLTKACDENRPTSNCPILESIEPQEKA